MRILLTGASGFIGSTLVGRLATNGDDIHLIERYVTGRYVQGRKEPVKTYFMDLVDFSSVRRAVREIQPEAVIHLAAISPVAYSYDHPLEVLETNLISTVNLAEACHKEAFHFQQFLLASTSETYGEGPNPKTEETQQNPNSPYSVSKHACEKYMLYMRDAYNFPVTILRPFNTYGRRENLHFVVERLISQMLTQNKVSMGDPSPVRDLLYVEDHVNAYLSCLGNQNAMGRVFNFCTGKGTSVAALADKISGLVGFRGELLWHQIPTRPLDIKTLIGSYETAKRVLGWEPKYDLDKGLGLSVEYWRNKLKR